MLRTKVYIQPFLINTHMLIGWVWVSQVFIICSSLWVWLSCAMLGQGSEGVKGFSTDYQELLKFHGGFSGGSVLGLW